MPSEIATGDTASHSSTRSLGRRGNISTWRRRDPLQRGYAHEIHRVLPLLGASSSSPSSSDPMSSSASNSQSSSSLLSSSPSIAGYWFGPTRRPEISGLLRSFKMWWVGLVIWQVRVVRRMVGRSGGEGWEISEDEKRELRAAAMNVFWGIPGRLFTVNSSSVAGESDPRQGVRGPDEDDDEAEDGEYIPDSQDGSSESEWTEDGDECTEVFTIQHPSRSALSPALAVGRSSVHRRMPSANFTTPSRETTPFDSELPASELGTLISDLSPTEASALLARLSSSSFSSHISPPSSPQALTRRAYSLLPSPLAFRQTQRPPSEQENDFSRFSCVICTIEPRSIILWPCRCLALCDECRGSLAARSSSGKHMCPCCRQA